MNGSSGFVEYFCEAPRARLRLPGLEVRDRVLFLDCRHERSRSRPSEVLSREGLGADGYELLVLRGGPGFAAEVVAHDPDLTRHFRPSAIAIVEPGLGSEMRGPRVIPMDPDGDEPVGWSIALLREIEIWGLICAREALLTGEGAHFEVASGRHIAEYVRVRDAFADVMDVERMADWILPGVGDGTVVLGDRPALVPLLQAVSNSCLRRFGWNVPIATLDHYPRRERSSGQTISELRRAGARSLLAVFAVDSGARHETELSMLWPDESTFSSFCIVDITPQGHVSDRPFRHHPVDSWAVRRNGECDRCSAGSVLHRIDPRTEERQSRNVRKPVKLTLPRMKSGAEFWRAVDRTNAVRLHADVAYDDGQKRHRRHRPVDLDIRALLEDPTFRDRCRGELQRCEAPDLVILPRHESTAALCELLEESIGVVAAQIVRVPRTHIDERVARRARAVDRVLLVDDALVTGQTLRGLVDNLRIATGSRWREISCSAFVAVSCPDSAGAEQSVENALHRPDRRAKNLRYGVRTLLPPHTACPFCEERQWLKGLMPAMSRHESIIETRLEQLEAEMTSKTLLFSSSASPHTAVADSVLGERVDAVTAFAAFASASQELKDDFTRNDPHRSECFDVSHSIKNWYDAPVLAGTLRTFGEEDLSYVAEARRIRDALRWRRMSARELTEVAWAAVTDKLPPAVVPAVQEALRDHADDKVAAFMADALTVRLGA